jgi:hypothetical protein
MRNATASKIDNTQTEIGRMLARRGVDLLLAIEDGNALVQAQVSSAVAAAMLAPLGGEAAGQFRALPRNLVEIDAAVTLDMAGRMLAARDAAQGVRARLH